MPDHPRSRGVYGPSCPTAPSIPGSSPLARGLPGRPRQQPRVRRIIPARAGFTPAWRYCISPSQDHPRSRGVYCGSFEAVRCGGGSSPLARGLPRPLGVRQAAAGIIPARAGFTPATGRPGPSRTDHPRSRGVYVTTTISTDLHAGSSPLARGLQNPLAPFKRNSRIIPARAGFTGRVAGHADRGRDHPRSRGVYQGTSRTHSVPYGSSPLARGLHCGRLRQRLLRGIIPARAGFTARKPERCSQNWDHPRSRGVYGASWILHVRVRGSSPLARGLPLPL